MKYTTVNPSYGQSKAKEKEKGTEKSREYIDDTYSSITSNSSKLSELREDDKAVIAITKDVIDFTVYEGIEENVETRKESQIIEYCNGNGTFTRTNFKGAWEEPITNYHTCENCTGKGHETRKFEVDVKTIKNVNLGLFRREQPDLSIEENIKEVEVRENGQKYTYKYNAIVTDETKADVQAQFQSKQSYTYRRPVNPSDIAYLRESLGKDANNETMEVYVTYEVKVTNESTSLISDVHSIINCYDSRYTLESATIDGNVISYNESRIYNKNDLPETDFKEITLSGLNIKIKPNETSSSILLRYKVGTEAILGLLSEDATLSNVVEIESYSTYYGETTLYAEQQTGGRTGQPYGGYDKDSHPGNAGIKLEEVNYTYTYKDSNGNTQTKTYESVKVLKSTENVVTYEIKNGEEIIRIENMPEDDTDIAPSFLLCKEDETKTLSGTVFEDLDVTENEERLGDGKYDSSTEKNVQNVKVELYELDEEGNGSLAILYDKVGNVIENGAVQYTDENGNYAFKGIVTGKEYYLKFTYGNDTSVLTQGATTIKDIEPVVNARNYKSTIITNEIVKGILNKKYEEFSEEDKLWYIKIDDNNSVAVDNMVERVAIEDLQYSNFEKALNMTSYTKPYIVPVEFDVESSREANEYGNIGISNNFNKLDFGIIERPREDLFVDKTITNIKITLSNGQELMEGDPRTESLPYGKVMGFRAEIYDGKAAEKHLLAEMDAELIQGAQLEIDYEVKVTNNNEIDYDYGEISDYRTEESLKDYDKYIATGDKVKYYYYGSKEGLTEKDIIVADIDFVDYLDGELVYKETEQAKWTNMTTEEITNLDVSAETHTSIKNNGYKVYRENIQLARKSTYTKTMSVSKVLTNKDDNALDNSIEIIRIDGKTARTIQEVEGTVVTKTYKPGNYVPTSSSTEEQDDDRVKVTITPPTGTTNYIVTYVIAGLVGLVVIVVGVLCIKKKSIN